jgi:hypothetical protein
MSLHRDEIAGQLGGVELISRHLTWVMAHKVAAIVEIRPDGPTRLHFDGGGHIDMCGPAEHWRTELAILREKRLDRRAG